MLQFAASDNDSNRHHCWQHIVPLSTPLSFYIFAAQFFAAQFFAELYINH